jgi:hypothetical protein
MIKGKQVDIKEKAMARKEKRFGGFNRRHRQLKMHTTGHISAATETIKEVYYVNA